MLVDHNIRVIREILVGPLHHIGLGNFLQTVKFMNLISPIGTLDE